MSMAASLAPSRARDADSSATAWSTSRRACSASASGATVGSASTPGQRRISPTDSGRAPGAPRTTSAAAFASSPTRARSTARPTAPAAARVSEIRHSTLPRFNSARMRSRSAASRPRSSSGRRSWTSRNRWLTERSSTESATPGSSAATAAKPVMLTIIAETRRIQAIFATLLWAPSSGECMRYLLHAQARERTLACELQASSADNRHPMQPCPSPIKPSQAGTSC